MAGWILLHRSLSEHWLWQGNEPYDHRSAWVDLLMLANFSDTKEFYDGRLEKRERGKVYCSQYWLAKRWRWDRRKVMRYLMALQEDGMVSVDSTTNGTTITIENYNKYQIGGTTHGTSDGTTDGTSDGTTDGTHTKKDKEKIKKDKEGIYKGLPDDLKKALLGFEEMRRTIKKPMTDIARKRLLDKLNKLSDNTSEQVAILEQSIYHSWQDVYALKESNGYSTASTKESFEEMMARL